jgi:pSer/pThr/pTyr-binding forkhead associated (FHA) protein
VFTIGRSPDSDLPLGDITVSWRHAELRRSGGAWVLTDLGSTNGTRVNGWRADSGFTVRAGDRVSFGRAAFVLADAAQRRDFFLQNGT